MPDPDAPLTDEELALSAEEMASSIADRDLAKQEFDRAEAAAVDLGALPTDFVTREEALDYVAKGFRELEEEADAGALYRPTSKIGDIVSGITADASRAVETMARMEKACTAFLRAYAEPVDMVPLEEIDRSAYVATGTLKGAVEGQSIDLERVDELAKPEAASDPERV
jgi:hypothetical protein